MKRAQIFRVWMVALTMVATVATSLSCTRSHIFEYEGDCDVYYDIRIKYDYNIKFADAFAHEVNSLALYIFTEDGILYDMIVTTDKQELAKENFTIRLTLPEGDYTMLAWGGINEESFDLLTEVEIGTTRIEQMQVKMTRNYDSAGNAYSDTDLEGLFHGMMELNVTSEPGIYQETLSLMKNTNVVRIVLHEMSGHAMDSGCFTFEITDHSGLYDYDNARLEDEAITYKPWYIEEIFADFDDQSTRSTDINAVMAELTIGRMMAGESPILRVLNSETGEQILSLPLADYMLLIKGNYHHAMGDQEYLDRQDEYSLTLFLNEGEWVSSQIVINGWRVVINDTGLN
ncbi:MAG: FimB/Mfa2 family fimbrial subunit [Alistipes sp.]|nr:FimB/Mfa2 family fimbrial subunit [Alistipes sp.]